jgi:hypothetical protein
MFKLSLPPEIANDESDRGGFIKDSIGRILIPKCLTKSLVFGDEKQTKALKFIQDTVDGILAIAEYAEEDNEDSLVDAYPDYRIQDEIGNYINHRDIEARAEFYK